MAPRNSNRSSARSRQHKRRRSESPRARRRQTRSSPVARSPAHRREKAKSLTPAIPPVIAPSSGRTDSIVDIVEPYIDSLAPSVSAAARGEPLAAAAVPPAFGRRGISDSDPNAPDPIDPNLGLEKVGGVDEHIKYLNRHVVSHWRDQHAATGLNEIAQGIVKPVKGILFYGPSGTGKTLLAKSLAATLSRGGGKPVSFFMRKGTNFHSNNPQITELKLQILFGMAVSNSPSIIFLDELDGIYPFRYESATHMTNYVTSALLSLIDGVKAGNVLVIMATNSLASIDSTLLRTGRFDRHLNFNLPTELGRFSILDIKLGAWGCHKPNVEVLRAVARAAVGFNGAQLENLIDLALEVAVERQMPTFGVLGDKTRISELNKVQVSREDWLKAVTVAVAMAKSSNCDD